MNCNADCTTLTEGKYHMSAADFSFSLSPIIFTLTRARKLRRLEMIKIMKLELETCRMSVQVVAITKAGSRVYLCFVIEH